MTLVYVYDLLKTVYTEGVSISWQHLEIFLNLPIKRRKRAQLKVAQEKASSNKGKEST